MGSIETGAVWPFLEEYFNRYLPAGRTATLIPNVGLTIRDENRLNRTKVGYRRHDGKVAIPRFLPLDGGRVVGWFNGRQTHDIVMFLADRAKPGQGIDLLGYTFDHPAIADALTNAEN